MQIGQVPPFSPEPQMLEIPQVCHSYKSVAEWFTPAGSLQVTAGLCNAGGKMPIMYVAVIQYHYNIYIYIYCYILLVQSVLPLQNKKCIYSIPFDFYGIINQIQKGN